MNAASSCSLRARYVFPAVEAPLADGCVTFAGRGSRRLALDRRRATCSIWGTWPSCPGWSTPTRIWTSPRWPCRWATPADRWPIGSSRWSRGACASGGSEGDSPIFVERKSGQSPRGVRQGLAESIRLGTTTLGDIAQPGWPLEREKGDRHHLPERPGGCLAQMVPVPFFLPLRAVLFQELLAPTRARVADAERLAREHLRCGAGFASVGLSPHCAVQCASRVVGLDGGPIPPRAHSAGLPPGRIGRGDGTAP